MPISPLPSHTHRMDIRIPWMYLIKAVSREIRNFMYASFGQLPLIIQDWIATQVASTSLHGIKRAKHTSRKTREEERKGKKESTKHGMAWGKKASSSSAMTCGLLWYRTVVKSWIFQKSLSEDGTSTYTGQHNTQKREHALSGIPGFEYSTTTHVWDRVATAFGCVGVGRQSRHCPFLWNLNEVHYCTVFTKTGIWSV